jgi:diguanylate cyclase (GGDEF)-like protein
MVERQRPVRHWSAVFALVAAGYPFSLGAVLGALIAVLAAACRYAGVDGGSGICFDIAWTGSALSAMCGALAARRRALPGNRARWTLWSLAGAAWLAAQVAWDVYGVIGFPASPNLADLGWWAFALLMMAGMLRARGASRAMRVVAVLESVPLVSAAIAFAVAELWPLMLASRLPLASKLSCLVYPGVYASAAILTLQAMHGGTLRGVRAWSVRLVLVGLTAQTVAFSLWSGLLLRGAYVPGNSVLDPLWVIGLVAIAAGGLVAAAHPEPVVECTEPGSAGVVLPAGMFLALIVALIVRQLAGQPETSAMILRLGLLFSGTALIVRSSLLARLMRATLNRERAALSSLAEREAELARLNQRLVEDSRRDPLTGIGNRRALDDDLPMYESLQREDGTRLAVALCDVDHFKSYNDRLGHLTGDQALRFVASTARAALRPTDTAYRFGGEELLLVLRDVSGEEAVAAAERVRAAVEHAGVHHPEGQRHRLTVSVGVASGEGDFAQLLQNADAALYHAKRSGRNRVVAADADTSRLPARGRPEESGPVPRHLRSMLAVSRAAASGNGTTPVLDTLAETIRAELSFQVVVVNLLEREHERLRVVTVLGDERAQLALLDTTRSLRDWHTLLAAGENIHGAVWLRAGTYELDGGWTPPASAALTPDAWQPDDMLLLPLRGAADELLAVVSVDQPVLGRRPTEEEIGVLMAVADHAGLALDQIQREGATADGGSAELRLAAVMLLAETLDLRDPSTARHARTVGQLAQATAAALRLSEARIERIQAAGVLHDLGKLGIADAILHKPGPLDDDEWREMRAHPVVGARILEHAGMRDIAAWVRAHHERVDGAGYPHGLRGRAIPLEARILAVADSYEAMIADRPYRAGMPPEQAREELLRCAGTQFDPNVVSAFLRALEARDQPGDDAGTGASRARRTGSQAASAPSPGTQIEIA